MKKLRSLLAVLLALVVAVSCLATTASAATAKNHKTYKRYLSLGDSVATGWGPYNLTNRGFSRIDFAYPSLLADTLGSKLVPLARNGFRTTELRYMIDSSYNGDKYNFRFGKISKATVKKYRPKFPKEIAKADLITLGIGSNDCLNLAKVRVKDFLKQNGGDDSKLAAIMAEDDAGSGMALGSLLSMASDMGIYALAVGVAIDSIWDGYYAFIRNYKQIIRQIYKLNPDVELVCVGLYNPLKEVQVLPIELVPIGRAFDVVCKAQNAYIEYGCAYSTKYIYVDVWDTPVYDIPCVLDDDFAGEASADIHPTKPGHKYIMNQILKALPTK